MIQREEERWQGEKERWQGEEERWQDEEKRGKGKGKGRKEEWRGGEGRGEGAHERSSTNLYSMFWIKSSLASPSLSITKTARWLRKGEEGRRGPGQGHATVSNEKLGWLWRRRPAPVGLLDAVIEHADQHIRVLGKVNHQLLVFLDLPEPMFI